MKLSFIILLAAILQVSASAFAQKISLDLHHVTLSQTLKEIGKQSGYNVFYDAKLLRKALPVSIKVSNAPLADVLSQCFEQQSFTFLIEERTIVVTPKKLQITVPAAAITITGTVTDSKGQPLPGVNILLKGTSIGTVTDAAGKYSIKLPDESSTLLFSFVGYETKEVNAATSPLDVTMVEKLSGLSEVVVVGYGTQKRVNLTGAVATVDMKKQQNAPLSNASQLLQGVEGVYVNQAGGQPGRDVATIRIRGVGTLNNNNPLVLVNGIEFALENVNPADIESISVLKDAASAAIYGSRAANGVILITTKGGKKDKFTVDYNFYAGSQRVNYLPDFLLDPIQFMELRDQAQRNEGKTAVDYSDALIAEYKVGMLTDPVVYPNNDWRKIMFTPSLVQNHDLRFSAGTDKITYALSLNYLQQNGVLRGTDSKRYALSYNTTGNVSDKLKIGSYLNASYKDNNEPVAGVANLMEMTFKAQAFHPTYLPDGRYANTFIRTPGHNVFRNPLALAHEGENNSKLQRVLLNVFGEYKLPANITYKINGAINKGDDFISQFVPEIYTYQVKTQETQLVPYDGQGNRGTRQTNPGSLNTTLFNTLNWEGIFAQMHELKALAGFSRETFSNRSFYAHNEGYLGNTLYELNAGSSNPAVGGTSSASALNSFFGRINYVYDDKYLAEANVRYDGSSRFAEGRQWGFFPSFSLGWRINKERFMEKASWIDELKLRASIGQLGNQNIDLFRYVNLVTLGRDYPFGSTISSGAAVTAYNDPTITWETTAISNVGFDASLFRNKISVTVDVFKKRTTNILSAVTIPAQIGALTGPIQNIGTVDNTGTDISLGFNQSIGDFRFNLNGGITYVKNKVVDLHGGVIYSGRQIITEGSPINSYYLINSAGIFQTLEEISASPFQNINTKPGYLKYQDVNGDNAVTEADRIIQGSNIPKLTYQLNLNLNYKRFSLNTFFQGVGTVYIYTENIGAMPFWFGTSVTKEWITDSWTPENTGARLPILTTFEGSQTENFRSSNFWLKNAAYLRMKNIQLSFSLPEQWAGKSGITRALVFVNGQNLLTFTPLKGFDPEKNLNGSTFYEFPTVKTITAGINVTF